MHITDIYYYCGVCGMTPTYFHALCEEKFFLQTHFMNSDADFTVIYNHMIANNLARTDMHNWRNDISHNIFDNHQHTRFAVDEMWRVLGICTWARVASRYNLHMNLLQINQFQTMTDAHEVLLNQFTAFFLT